MIDPNYLKLSDDLQEYEKINIEFNDDIIIKPNETIKKKCLIKLLNSPMKNKETDDEVIKELQKKLNELSDAKLKDTYWEIETGDYLNGEQINELEIEKDKIIKKLNPENKIKKINEIYETIIGFCKKYEELCIKKYPEAPLPLEVLKSLN